MPSALHIPSPQLLDGVLSLSVTDLPQAPSRLYLPEVIYIKTLVSPFFLCKAAITWVEDLRVRAVSWHKGRVNLRLGKWGFYLVSGPVWRDPGVRGSSGCPFDSWHALPSMLAIWLAKTDYVRIWLCAHVKPIRSQSACASETGTSDACIHGYNGLAPFTTCSMFMKKHQESMRWPSQQLERTVRFQCGAARRVLPLHRKWADLVVCSDIESSL